MKHTQLGSPQNKPKYFWLVFCTLSLLLCLQVYLVLSWGRPHINLAALLPSFQGQAELEQARLILWEIRLPRALAAILVGASFAVSGALMQGITRNPIADPGLLGINAGAGLFLIAGYATFQSLHYLEILGLSLAGATIATALVFLLAYRRKEGLNPLALILAGAMITSLFTALGQGLTLYFNLSTTVIGWQAGGLGGTNWSMLAVIAPFILLGLVLAQLLSHQLTIFSLDEEVAQGLGQNTLWMRVFLLILVLILSAGAVALVGSIALMGLVIPHLVRIFFHKHYRLLLPLTALLGANFLLFCDWLAILWPATPLNSWVSLLILPSFLYLMRKGQFYERS